MQQQDEAYQETLMQDQEKDLVLCYAMFYARGDTYPYCKQIHNSIKTRSLFYCFATYKVVTRELLSLISQMQSFFLLDLSCLGEPNGMEDRT